jgi:hypothetical protein
MAKNFPHPFFLNSIITLLPQSFKPNPEELITKDTFSPTQSPLATAQIFHSTSAFLTVNKKSD